MSGADDLRTAIARENFYWDGTTRAYWGELDWGDVPESTHEQHLEHADAIIALFADPVRRLAILDAMNLDVSRATPRWSEFAGNDVLDVESWPDMGRRDDYLVVRPRGEATK